MSEYYDASRDFYITSLTFSPSFFVSLLYNKNICTICTIINVAKEYHHLSYTVNITLPFFLFEHSFYGGFVPF